VPDVESVTVQGEGVARATPDVLRLDLGVEAQGRTVSDALAGSSASMQAVLDALRVHGVDPADLQTTGLAIRSVHDRDGRRVVGYAAGSSLAVTLRDLDAAGAAIAAAADAGGDACRVHGLRFDVQDDTPLRLQARQAAVADARARAETYAAAADRALGRVLHISELGEGRPGPVRAGRMMAMEAVSAPVPLEAGAHEVSVNVTVEWALA
jgi:uncharacterized protein YggE